MKQKQFIKAFLIGLMAFISLKGFAAQHVETITLYPNGNEILTMPEYWRTYFTSGHSMIGNPTWTSSNPNVVRVSSFNKYTCRIHAQEFASIGSEADITCTFSYWEGVTYMTYSILWTVKIGSSGGGGDGGIIYPAPIPTDSWSNSGNYTISWYNKNTTEFTLTTNKELAGMAYLVNNNYTDFEGKIIKLGNDIDLTGKQWKTIGQGNNSFKGKFDGQGYTIFGIFIGKQDEDQSYYGFWGLVKKAVISNVFFEGDVFIDDPVTSNNVKCYIGGVAGYLVDSSIENCAANMSIAYSKDTPKANNSLYVGGLVGYMSSSALKYCSRKGDMDVRQNVTNSEPPFIGGLAGYGYGIEYCENISDNVYAYYPYGDHNSDNMRFGGIAGDGGTSITCCRSIIGKVEIVNKTPASTYFFIGGISGNGNSGNIINSYSSITSAKFNSVGMWYNSGGTMFGGICAGMGYTGMVKTNITASYSISDVEATSTRSLVKGNDGATSFSSEQMKTSAFLEELNMYSILYMDGPVWTQDEGGYPYIVKLHEMIVGIKPIVDNHIPRQGVYTLSGQKLEKPRKGLNIIGGRKVLVK